MQNWDFVFACRSMVISSVGKPALDSLGKPIMSTFYYLNGLLLYVEETSFTEVTVHVTSKWNHKGHLENSCNITQSRLFTSKQVS